MSQENPLFDLSLRAGEDLSADADRYKAVKLNGTTAKEVIKFTGATDPMIGILKNSPEDTQLAQVAVYGSSKIRAGGAFNANALLKTDAAGKFVTGGGGGDVNKAIALEAAGADGDVVEALLLVSPIVS
jgi:hypothetical protein